MQLRAHKVFGWYTSLALSLDHVTIVATSKGRGRSWDRTEVEERARIKPQEDRGKKQERRIRKHTHWL